MKNEAANVYALSLFEVASEKGIDEDILNEYREVSTVLSENSEMIKILDVPFISGEDKNSVLEKCFKGYLSETMYSYLSVLKENHRFSVVCEAFSEYERIYNEAKRISLAEVVSAYPIDEETQRKITDKLSSMTVRNVKATFKTDKSIIGGISVTVDSRKIEFNLKNRLEGLKRQLSDLVV